MRIRMFGSPSIGVRDSFGRLVRRGMRRGGVMRFLVREVVRVFGLVMFRCWESFACWISFVLWVLLDVSYALSLFLIGSCIIVNVSI
jgi:hypothetical protein